LIVPVCGDRRAFVHDVDGGSDAYYGHVYHKALD
jgi:hypothetical protein